jgi:carbonic anhydrase
MRTICLLWGGAALVWAQHAAEPAGGLGGNAAWKELLSGNNRYVMEKLSHPRQSKLRRQEVAQAQHPIAAVLGCADSRVPPEEIFDQGLGDIFTVRVAGNVPDDAVIASLEYAVEHLGPRLIVVLGHQRCGAVDAALKGGPPEGHLPALLDLIKPAVATAKSQPGDALDNAVRANIRNTVERLKHADPILAGKIQSGAVKIVGARYDLDSGKVEVVQ